MTIHLNMNANEPLTRLNDRLMYVYRIDIVQQIRTTHESIVDVDRPQNSRQPIRYRFRAEMNLVDQHSPANRIVVFSSDTYISIPERLHSPLDEH